MAFKKINKTNEEAFLNGARGDKEISKTLANSNKKPLKSFRENENLKRKFQLTFYVNEEELAELRENAERMKMNVNQYIRFKTFNPTQS